MKLNNDVRTELQEVQSLINVNVHNHLVLQQIKMKTLDLDDMSADESSLWHTRSMVLDAVSQKLEDVKHLLQHVMELDTIIGDLEMERLFVEELGYKIFEVIIYDTCTKRDFEPDCVCVVRHIKAKDEYDAQLVARREADELIADLGLEEEDLAYCITLKS